MSQSCEAIFNEARTLQGIAREAYLRGACGTDVALLARVEALLAADAEAAGFLKTIGPGDDEPTCDTGPHGMHDRVASAERPGQMIGRYKLLQPIGEGGFGTVWLSEQREPVKRRVALKIIKLGMDTKQVIARFEAERQALALMDHPNIAKVLDAGSTETGRPYFVMEYVRGVGILEYCDTEKLDTRARLELFIHVCNAIQHAHQKGIIHRDIKPSNVMVTLHDGVPVPMVIDFGVAKATNTELTQKTLFTEHRQMIGTPAYMSPEQAEMSGLDIDTRSDIYALGVLLYELLTGTTPFDSRDLASRGYAEMMRIIREQEPPRPSTRLSSLGATAARTAQQRRADARRLGMLLRGDLDWIVMKCLEKDRTRRFETASGLAADIGRHLRSEPVLAGPPGSVYRLRKFLSRNRAAAALAAIVFVAIAAGLSMALAGLAEARRGETVARHAFAEADEARRVAEERRSEAEATLTDYEEVLDLLPPSRCRVAVLPMENGTGDADQAYFASGMTRSLIDDLALVDWIDVQSYESVARYLDAGGAASGVQAARDLNVQVLVRGTVTRGAEATTIAFAVEDAAAGRTLLEQRLVGEAGVLRERVAREVVHAVVTEQGRRQQEVHARRDTDDPEAWEAYIAGLHNLQGAGTVDADRAIAAFEKATQLDPDYALAYMGMARAYVLKATLGVRPEEYNEPARRAAVRAIELDETLAGAHAVLGQVHLQYDWRWDMALREFTRALELDANMPAAHTGLAQYYATMGDFDRSVEHLRTAVELDPAWLLVDESLLYTAYFARDLDTAIELCQRALGFDRRFWAPYAWMGLALTWQGDLEAGVAALEEAHRLEPDSPVPLGLLASAYALNGQRAEAEAKLEELLVWSDAHYVCPYEIATVYLALGDVATAYEFLELALNARAECVPFMVVDYRMDSEQEKPEFREFLHRASHPLADKPRPWLESTPPNDVR